MAVNSENFNLAGPKAGQQGYIYYTHTFLPFQQTTTATQKKDFLLDLLCIAHDSPP